MALVTTYHGDLRFEDLQFERGVFSGTSTVIRYTVSAGAYYEYGGNFQYDDSGQLTGGTITSILQYINSRPRFTAEDFAADATKFFRLTDPLAAAAMILSGDDKLVGRTYGDSLYGFDGDDRLAGRFSYDDLYGGAGNDVLRGGRGADHLVGGTGLDRLIGGTEADTFVFTSLLDSTVASDGRDRILDFSHAEHDQIDLSQIDAITGGGDDAFTLVDTFHNVAGELTFSTAATGFLVVGDVDGDGAADFSILVVSAAPLVSSDFVL